MSWTATRQINQYEPTPASVGADEFAQRIKTCEPCRHRAINCCRIAGQMCSMMARQPQVRCPLGLWEQPAKISLGRAACRVDVIIPSYNCADYLVQCIESLTAQSWPLVNIVVVNDGSTDDTREVCDRMNIDCVTHPKRLGAQHARQTGADLTHAEYLLFADADAVYHPGFITQLIEGIESHDADVAYADYTVVTGDRGEERRLRDVDVRRLWMDNFIAMPSLIRRSALPAALPTGRCFHDWLLWMDLLQRGQKFVHVPRVLFTVFRRDEGITQQVRSDPASWYADLLRLRRRHLRLVALEPISVVIPAHGNERLTAECIEALAGNTSVEYDLIYVDNGSTPAAVRYVCDAAKNYGVKLRLLRNGTNLGFTRAVKQGIKSAGRRDVLVLNNDCFVSPGCVDLMVLGMAAHDDCGAIGPLTCDGSEQSLLRGRRASQARYRRDVHSADWFDLPGMAYQLGIRQYTTTDEPMLPWFCCLLRRQAIDDVGPLRSDGVFASGLGTDDDWCQRARLAGWNLRVHLSAYAAHRGGETFRLLGIDRDRESRKARAELACSGPRAG